MNIQDEVFALGERVVTGLHAVHPQVTRIKEPPRAIKNPAYGLLAGLSIEDIRVISASHDLMMTDLGSVCVHGGRPVVHGILTLPYPYPGRQRTDAPQRPLRAPEKRHRLTSNAKAL